MATKGLMHVNMLICYWKVNTALPISSLRKMSLQPTFQVADNG